MQETCVSLAPLTISMDMLFKVLFIAQDKKVKGEKPVYEKESVEHIKRRRKVSGTTFMPSVRVEKPKRSGDKDYPKTLNVEGYDKPDEKLKLIVTESWLRRMLMLPRHVCSLAKAKRAKLKEDTLMEKGMSEKDMDPDPEKDKKLGGPGANQGAR